MLLVSTQENESTIQIKKKKHLRINENNKGMYETSQTHCWHDSSDSGNQKPNDALGKNRSELRESRQARINRIHLVPQETSRT